MVNLNVNAMVFLSRYFADRFTKRNQLLNGKSRCAIINYASINAILPSPKLSMYNGTKAFNRMFSNTLNLDYQEQGIDVLTVMPMSVKTQMNSGIYMFTVSAE